MSVDYRETLVTYLRSSSQDEAAKTLGISLATLKGRIAAMKKAGVNVPSISRKTALGKLEVAQLNSVINKYKKETQ